MHLSGRSNLDTPFFGKANTTRGPSQPRFSKILMTVMINQCLYPLSFFLPLASQHHETVLAEPGLAGPSPTFSVRFPMEQHTTKLSFLLCLCNLLSRCWSVPMSCFLMPRLQDTWEKKLSPNPLPSSLDVYRVPGSTTHISTFLLISFGTSHLCSCAGMLHYLHHSHRKGIHPEELQ